MLACQILFTTKRYLLAMRKKFAGIKEYHDVDDFWVVIHLTKIEYSDKGVIISQNDFNLTIPYDCYEFIQVFHDQA